MSSQLFVGQQVKTTINLPGLERGSIGPIVEQDVLLDGAWWVQFDDEQRPRCLMAYGIVPASGEVTP